LEEKYHLKKYPERLEVRLTAEEYFTKAEEAQKSRRFKDAIFYYDQIIKYYKNNTDDYKAAFMKAFLHAEEMNQKEEALTQFKAFIQNFPEGELHESANFMINELEGKSDFLQSFDK
jgi:outer membrane protein assembly factor BamD (BamD/ComL family)